MRSQLSLPHQREVTRQSRSNCSFSSAAPPPPIDQGCLWNSSRWRISHADELALGPRLVDLRHDRGPDKPLGRIVRCAGLAADAHDGADRLGDRRAVAAEEDHSRRAVPGNVGPAGVDTWVRSTPGIPSRPAKYSSMSFLPNSRFIKLLAVICPTNPPCPRSPKPLRPVGTAAA